MATVPERALNDGSRIPLIGLGTYPMDDAQAERAVAGALALGYRLIDTAVRYGNEAGTGRGIARSGVPREEITVTTKLPGRDHGYEETLRSFEQSRRRLGLDRVDLYLVHWPLPRVGRFADSWRAMLRLRADGLVRSVGVSNFTPAHLDVLERETGVRPAVNQVELHPMLRQDALRAAHRALGVVTESWSPLGRGSGLLEDPAVTAAARDLGVTPAQVVLRWHVQLGAVPIPKSADPERQRRNLDVFGFELTARQMAAISARGEHRLGGDPDTHEEF